MTLSDYRLWGPPHSQCGRAHWSEQLNTSHNGILRDKLLDHERPLDRGSDVKLAPISDSYKPVNGLSQEGPSLKKFVCFAFLLSCFYPMAAYAKPKEKIYKNPAADVFQAALRSAREEHVVTYVDEKNLMLTFETGVSALSYGFVANASVEPLPDGGSKLLINVQHKNDGKNVSYSFGAGDRMANKFFEKVEEELAQHPAQKAEVQPDQHADAPPEAKPAAVAEQTANATVTVNSTPDGADITIDGGFVGNTPSTLKLAPGKHTIAVSVAGFQSWSRDMTVNSGSEIKLSATLQKK